jgi:hypothetical protein
MEEREIQRERGTEREGVRQDKEAEASWPYTE